MDSTPASEGIWSKIALSRPTAVKVSLNSFLQIEKVDGVRLQRE